MNGTQYFEEHPWKRACRLIREQKMGPVHQIIVQCICEKESLQSSYEHWKEQVSLLAGEERSGDLLKAGSAVAYIGSFGDGTIVRLFFDAAGDDICENFEIVAEGGLLVWKPVGTNQGHIYSTDGCQIVCRQQYVEELEVTL